MASLSIASPPCVAETFEGEVVVLNLDTGYYFSLPALAGAIWRDLENGHTTDDIVAGLAARHPELHARAEDFIGALMENGLLREEPNRLDERASLPEMLSVKLAEQGVREVVFDAFDDMRDLVMTDPIHDVDEQQGWPVRQDDGA